MTKKKEPKMPNEPRTIESLASAEDVPGTWESIAVKVAMLMERLGEFQKHVEQGDNSGRSQLMWIIHNVHLIAYEWGWLEAREVVRKQESIFRKRIDSEEARILDEANDQAHEILSDAQNKARRTKARMRRVAKNHGMDWREISKAEPKRKSPHLRGARRKK